MASTKKKGDVEPGPRNIITNPPKKGTFGFVRTTLSERQAPGGVAGEYKYLADAYSKNKTKQSVQEDKASRLEGLG